MPGYRKVYALKSPEMNKQKRKLIATITSKKYCKEYPMLLTSLSLSLMKNATHRKVYKLIDEVQKHVSKVKVKQNYR